MEQMIINRLPAPTWNRLKVNQTTITHPGVLPEAKVTRQNVDVCMAEDAWTLEGGLSAELKQLFTTAEEIVIPEGADIEKTMELRLDLTDGGAYAVAVKAGAGSTSRLMILQQGQGKGTAAVRLQVQLGENANMQIGLAQCVSGEMISLEELAADVADHAQLTVTQLELGAEKAHVGNKIVLTGKESSYDYDCGYRLPGNALDMNLIVRHLGRRTVSRMDALGVLENDSHKCFRGTIDFVRGCAGAKGSETEDVLLLGDELVNQTVPLILCDEEDVDGSHGASIGNLDEGVRFYLASRGMDDEQIRQELANARMRAVCAKLPESEIKNELTRMLAGEMGEDENDA